MGYIKLRKMVKKNNKLMILSLIALILVGGLFAGTHRANQILSGTFLGNYTFEGKVDFSNATLISFSRAVSSAFFAPFKKKEVTSSPYLFKIYCEFHKIANNVISQSSHDGSLKLVHALL